MKETSCICFVIIAAFTSLPNAPVATLTFLQARTRQTFTTMVSRLSFENCFIVLMMRAPRSSRRTSRLLPRSRSMCLPKSSSSTLITFVTSLPVWSATPDEERAVLEMANFSCLVSISLKVSSWCCSSPGEDGTCFSFANVGY